MGRLLKHTKIMYHIKCKEKIMGNNLIIVAGLYGSGKSTLVKRLLEDFSDSVEPFIYNVDEKFSNYCRENKVSRTKIIREKFPEMVIEENNLLLEAAMTNRDVIIDKICLSVKGRIIYSEKECLKGYKKICHFILPPQSNEEELILLDRLKKRDQYQGLVSPDGIKESKTLVQIPNLDEGFDEVYYYNILGERLEYIPSYELNA